MYISYISAGEKLFQISCKFILCDHVLNTHFLPFTKNLCSVQGDIIIIACEQALRGALAAGREKKGELATKSPEFEYLHRKSRCEMLIGGHDLRKDVITLGKCFVYIRARLLFALIGGKLTAQSTGSHREMEWNSNSRDVQWTSILRTTI